MKGIGLLEIPGGILCKKDALGQQFRGEISGIDVAITFPSLADDSGKEGLDLVGMKNQLIAPVNGTRLTLGGERIYWGEPRMAPEMNSFVKCVTLEVDCDEHEVYEVAQKLYTGVQDWTRLLKRFLHLLTKQQRTPDAFASGVRCCFDENYKKGIDKELEVQYNDNA